MYEHRTAPLLPASGFRWRLARHGIYAVGVLAISLLVGTVGFHLLAGQTTIDALLNAAMLLGGMGPVGEIVSTPGKLFAAAYALYAGLVFLVTAAIGLAPILHRFLHKFHLEEAQRRDTHRR
jgi:hypothetical protein